MGEDDSAAFYRRSFDEVGGSDVCFKYTHEKPTGRCLSLITPDGERTMRTDLGAAMLLTPDEVSAVQFNEFTHVHMEGYTLLDDALAQSVFEAARSGGCAVSLDLASFEVVRAVGNRLPTWLRAYVDMVFANEDESRAFCGDAHPERGLDALGALCTVAAVKLGGRGAWLQQNDRRIFTPAKTIETLVDTTGAGDCWAGGFLYGLIRGWSLEDAGTLAAIIGAETVSTLGAFPGQEGWKRIFDTVRSM
jgi:sugar/nucleoside kinase (ribokinase family)